MKNVLSLRKCCRSETFSIEKEHSGKAISVKPMKLFDIYLHYKLTFHSTLESDYCSSFSICLLYFISPVHFSVVHIKAFRRR